MLRHSFFYGTLHDYGGNFMSLSGEDRSVPLCQFFAARLKMEDPDRWYPRNLSHPGFVGLILNNRVVQLWGSIDEALAWFLESQVIVSQDAPPEWYYALGV